MSEILVSKITEQAGKEVKVQDMSNPNEEDEVIRLQGCQLAALKFLGELALAELVDLSIYQAILKAQHD
jgi:hypothetical protein